MEANNYATDLLNSQRFKEAKSHMRKTLPVARRVLGDNNGITLQFRKVYPRVLSENPAATLDDLREAVTMLEDVERTARRVLGTAHPNVARIGVSLRDARAALRTRESPPPADK